MAKKRDNSTGKQKIALRRLMLEQMTAEPVVMETHGGVGQVWASVYAHISQGVVFEKNEEKAAHLARQRPTWAVYEADCIKALSAGAGAHLEVNVLDVDPYGEPWPVFDAFFGSTRSRPAVLWVAVNDGLRQGVGQGGAWRVNSLAEVVHQFGNDLHGRYLDVCKYLLQQKAAQAGYHLDRFAGYYCGAAKAMTHYLARLTLETQPGRA